MASEYSRTIKNGMKRLCKDFDDLISDADFKKTGHRRWKRERNNFSEQIHLWRNGSSYGAPISNSIDIRVNLSSENLAVEESVECKTTSSELIRKKDGYVYHLRFNAKSWSTYDLCLQDMHFFIKDYAEPWFDAQMNPNGLSSFFKKLFKGNS